jgi:hypothetical protein
MDTGHTTDSGNAMLTRRCGPIAAIRRASSFALIAIDEGGGDSARPHRDQGSPHPGNAPLCRIDGAGAARLRRRVQLTYAVRSMEPRSLMQRSLTPWITTSLSLASLSLTSLGLASLSLTPGSLTSLGLTSLSLTPRSIRSRSTMALAA